MRIIGKGDDVAHLAHILKLGVYLTDDWKMDYTIEANAFGDDVRVDKAHTWLPFTLVVTAVKGKNSSRRTQFAEVKMEYMQTHRAKNSTEDSLFVLDDPENELDGVDIQDKDVYDEIVSQCKMVLAKAIQNAKKQRKTWQDV